MAPVQVRPTLLESVHKVLTRTGLSAERLTFELTETADCVLQEEQLDTLAELTWYGIRIALDDFGTGYSSLRRAATLPIHMIKLDKSFVAALTESPEAIAVTRNVLRLGKELGADVVAEGVERRMQWDVLQSCGFDFIQGNLIKAAAGQLTEAVRL